MINIDKIKGKSVEFLGGTSDCFTEGSFYRIGVAHGEMFTVDDEGEQHWLYGWFLERGFDVSQFIKKPSMVGKYVRFIAEDSEFMRRGDIGLVAKDYGDGSLEVKWLNPIEPLTATCPTWFVGAGRTEIVQ